MSILITNIKKLIQVETKPCVWVAGADMSKLDTIDLAFLYIKEGIIKDFGRMGQMPNEYLKEKGLTLLDAAGKMVFPSFCDSHTHLVYAGSREIEYIDKIKGLSYEEIAKEGEEY